MAWTGLDQERWMLYSGFGMRVLDDFTGLPPIYPVFAQLQAQDNVGNWQTLDIDAVVTPTGVISYPALGRSAHAATQPQQQYRTRLYSDFYRPDYLINADGIPFVVHPYDDENPPANSPAIPQTVMLMPANGYAYPGHVRLVHGVVLDNANQPVANAEISEGVRERVLSDERGVFTLPLRWPAINAAVVLDAVDHRTGRTDQININLPGDLSQGHTFIVT
jgi:hypothetical protein